MPRQTEKTNTERVEELYESIAEGDMEAIRDIMHPGVELHMPKGIAGGGTFHGFDEIVENVRMETSEVTQGASEVIAYGTAVKLP